MPKPDLLRVSVSGRLARLAGRGPPEGSGKRWRSGHATDMPSKKLGANNLGTNNLGIGPNSDEHGATCFISPWHSDGAFLGETLPRVKVVTRSAHSADEFRGGQTPARHKSNMAGTTRTTMRSRRGGSFPTLASQAPTRPFKGSRAAGEDQGDRGYPLSPGHRPSGWTMTQTVPHRKRIVLARHERAIINIQAVIPHPIC